MKKEALLNAFNDGLNLFYKPKKTLYKLFSFVEIVDENNNETSGLCYQCKDGELYVRPIRDFDKFELTVEQGDFPEPRKMGHRELKSKQFKLSHEFINHCQVKIGTGKWNPAIIYACSMGKMFCMRERHLGNFTIGFTEKKKIKKDISDHYTELKTEANLKLWNGDLSTIPEEGTLVSFNTASNGDVNGVVTGYEITWYEGSPQIRVNLRYPGSKTSNQRFLEELDLPLSVREKELAEEKRKLSTELSRLKSGEDKF